MPWQGDEDSHRNIKTTGQLNAEGYVNVGTSLGLPSERGECIFRVIDCVHISILNDAADLSSYHEFWVRRQGRRGYF